MLALLGRSADGWLPSNGFFAPDKLPDMHRRIDEAALEAGRDPAEISRIYNVWGRITDGERRDTFDGPVEQWVDTLTGLVLDGGMDAFVFGADGDDPVQMRRFTDEVAPAVRRDVDRARGVS